MFRLNLTVASFFVFCLVSNIAGQEQSKSVSTIKIEAAMRVKILIDSEGKEAKCVLPESSPSSCLLLKISGIDPDKLVNIWINKGTGSIYLTAGDKKYNIGRIMTQDKSRFSLMEVNVPKDVKEFSLVVGEMPAISFKVDPAIVEKVSQAALFKESKRP